MNAIRIDEIGRKVSARQPIVRVASGAGLELAIKVARDGHAVFCW